MIKTTYFGFIDKDKIEDIPRGFRERVKRGALRFVTALRNIKPLFSDLIHSSRKGNLSWFYIVKLASRNVLYSRSRSFVSIGAIALGIGAIVILVAFGYGLQDIVTNRLVQPNALRLAEIVSDSTALSLNEKSVEQMRRLDGVEDIAVAVSLAGTVTYGDSRTDVVVIGLENRYMSYAHLVPVAGNIFSEEADSPWRAQCETCETELQTLLSKIQEDDRGVVLATATSSAQFGDLISGESTTIRLAEDRFVPVRSKPDGQSEILGYVEGSIIKVHSVHEVWGSEYQTVSGAGKVQQASDGKWFGKWLKGSFFLHKQTMPTVFEPLTAEGGSQVRQEGYISYDGVHTLSQDELDIERLLDDIMDEDVLGEATDSATLSAELVTVLDSTAASDEARLRAVVAQNTAKSEDTQVELGIVEVKREGGKEVLVTSRFLDALSLKPGDVLGKTISLEYIISGNVIQGLSGKVNTDPVEYKIVGIIDDTERAVVYTPLAEVRSLGVEKYSIGKVLAASEGALADVRTRIESQGFVTRSIVDTLVQVQKLFGVMRFLLGAFGMIALVVAIFGMVNTLTISLLERSAEIGVMKTIGTVDQDIMRLLIVEASILGAFGGIIGTVLGILVGGGINLVYILFTGKTGVSLFQFPMQFVFMVLFFSVIVGILTGLYPSLRSKSIKALDAIRYE